jgi:hypothetical protein
MRNICASLNILVATDQWISIFCHLAATMISNLMEDSSLCFLTVCSKHMQARHVIMCKTPNLKVSNCYNVLILLILISIKWLSENAATLRYVPNFKCEINHPSTTFHCHCWQDDIFQSPYVEVWRTSYAGEGGIANQSQGQSSPL